MSPTAFVTFAMVGAILAGTVVGLVEIARHTIAGIQRRADEPIPYLPIRDGVIVTDERIPEQMISIIEEAGVDLIIVR